MANGTAIEYDQLDSESVVLHSNYTNNVNVSDNSTYSGYLVEDNLCLDDEDEVCVERYSFYQVEEYVNNSGPVRQNSNTRQEGVIPFNKYGSIKYPNQRIVNLLDYEDILFNSTLHFDFNFPTKMFTSVESAPKSKVYFNGINSKEIKYEFEANQGVMWY